jgi:predicted DNA-binding antitoxin AbrB/MazE fold protein
MAETVEAVFEHGTFRLLEPTTLPLSDGQHVRLTVETATTDGVLALAEQVYAGLSDDDIDEIERIALDRRTFFSERS